ncbi:MAG: diguanylate cyclase [Actinomycetota bacterium]|nr:diguanylate cyclase [Actinomycetota bacterium]
MTSPPPRPEVTATIRERLQAIYERARGSFAEELATIDAGVNHLKAGALDEPERSAAERAAHRLAGTAGTFGFPEATAPAQRLEDAFTHQPHPDAAHRLATEVDALRKILAADQVPAPEQQRSPQPDAQVLALHATDDLDAQIRVPAAALGVGIAHDPRADVEAAIIDLAAPNGESLIRGYAERQPPIPILALVDTGSVTDRLMASNAGASLVLPRTGSPTDVVAAAMSLSEPPRHGQFRMLAVDDDPLMSAVLPAVLATEPLHVTTLEDPRDFWTVLEHTGPDLVVLDLDMPHLDGIALCRIIRTDPRWSTLPVLFLTASTDPAAIDAIFAAGADDYISKPLVASEVRARIRNRLDRVALYRALLDTDPLTGLLNRRRLERDFDRLSAFARRHHQPLSLALLDIDHVKRVNDTYGLGIGDLVLRRLADRVTQDFQGEDALARWGGDEIAILTVGMSGTETRQRLTGILESIRGTAIVLPERPQSSLSVSFSAGVAELGFHGDDLHTLTQAADAALHRAKRSGRGRVLVAEDETSTPPAARNPSAEGRPPPVDPAIHAYYATLGERERLETGHGRLERVRTQELLTRSLPAAPARILDVGGGTGVYAQWLAEAGYDVHLIDVVPEHIAHVSEVLGDELRFTVAVGDARHLDEPTNSADALMMLGPLYHLPDRDERLHALREARRVLRPGGVLAAAVISRHAALLACASRGELDPGRLDLALASLAHGRHDPQLGFTTAFFHTPEETLSEVREAGFRDVQVRAIEGPMWAAVKTCTEPTRLDALIQSALICARALEDDPALLAASAHLLTTGRA